MAYTDERGRLLGYPKGKTAQKTPRVRYRGGAVDPDEGKDLYSRTSLADKIAKKKVESAKAKDEAKADDGFSRGLAQNVGSDIARQGAGGGGGGPQDIAGGALIASGNPYAIGAGAGLLVLSARSKRKQREEEAAYQAKVNRIENQQKALQTFMNAIQGGGL